MGEGRVVQGRRSLGEVVVFLLTYRKDSRSRLAPALQQRVEPSAPRTLCSSEDYGRGCLTLASILLDCSRSCQLSKMEWDDC